MAQRHLALTGKLSAVGVLILMLVPALAVLFIELSATDDVRPVVRPGLSAVTPVHETPRRPGV